MLEYMLLRPIERQIFADTRDFFEAHPEEKFILILDEAHLYRGANGTEVAYLIRRLLDRLGLQSSRVILSRRARRFRTPSAAKDVCRRTFWTRYTGRSRRSPARSARSSRPRRGPIDLAERFRHGAAG